MKVKFAKLCHSGRLPVIWLLYKLLKICDKLASAHHEPPFLMPTSRRLRLLTWSPDSSGCTIPGEFQWSDCYTSAYSDPVSSIHGHMKESPMFAFLRKEDWNFSHLLQVRQIWPFRKSSNDLVVVQVAAIKLNVSEIPFKATCNLAGVLFPRSRKYSH